jgi:hemoglobin
MDNCSRSLYERLGGAPAIEAVVDGLLSRIAGDPELAPFFSDVDLRTHARSLRDLVAVVSGGPAQYRGPEMQRAHGRIAITDRHFDAVAGHLVAALEAAGADPAAADELVTIVAGLRGDIVNTPSTAVSQ